MAVRGASDGMVVSRRASGRGGLVGDSMVGVGTAAAGHHGIVGQMILFSFMLAWESGERNKSQFHRLELGQCSMSRLQDARRVVRVSQSMWNMEQVMYK